MATQRQPDGRLSNGGRRPGAGRPPGTPYRRLQDAKSLRERYPVWPLEHLLDVLNDPQATNARKDEAAKAAAPYLHPRLAAIDINNRPAQVRHKLDLTKLADEELEQLERITVKAQVTFIDEEPEDAPLIEHQLPDID